MSKLHESKWWVRPGLIVTTLSLALANGACGPVDSGTGLDKEKESTGATSEDPSQEDSQKENPSEQDPSNEDSGEKKSGEKGSENKSEESKTPEGSKEKSPDESEQDPSGDASTSQGDPETSEEDSSDEETGSDDSSEDDSGEDTGTGDDGGEKDEECKVTAKWGTGKPFAAGTHVPNWEMEAVFDQNENGQIDDDERTAKKVTLEDVYCATPRNKFAIITFSSTF